MRRALAFGCLCLLLSPAVAAAEWHLTPTVGLTFAANTSLVDLDQGTDKVHTHFGGTVSFLGGGVLGVEGLVIFTPGFFKGPGRFDEATSSVRVLTNSSRSLALMGNVVLTAPRRWTEYNLRPFVSGGIGLLQASYEQKFEGLPTQSVRMSGFNIGGGAIGFFSAHTGMRIDLRYYGNLSREGIALNPSNDTVHLRYMTVSVGLVVRR